MIKTQRDKIERVIPALKRLTNGLKLKSLPEIAGTIKEGTELLEDMTGQLEEGEKENTRLIETVRRISDEKNEEIVKLKIELGQKKKELEWACYELGKMSCIKPGDGCPNMNQKGACGICWAKELGKRQ